jgi:hypothetical protein
VTGDASVDDDASTSLASPGDVEFVAHAGPMRQRDEILAVVVGALLDGCLLYT